MHQNRRRSLMAKSLVWLRQYREDLDAVIGELESVPERREIDIAAEHSGEPDLVGEVLDVQDEGRWREQLQTIYCSTDRCPRCPHGPYWYTYRQNVRKGTTSIRYAGRPFVDMKLVDAAMAEGERRGLRPAGIFADDPQECSQDKDNAGHGN